MTSFHYDDPQYLCLCGIHVEQASLIVAYLNAALSFMMVVMNGFVKTDYFLASTMFVWCVLYLLVILGHRVRKPALFMPYLIAQAIGLIIIVLCAIVLLILPFVRPKTWHGQHRELVPLQWSSQPRDYDAERRLRIKAIVKPFAILVAFVLTGWFYTLIYRGWGFLKDKKDSERLQKDGFIPVAQQPFVHNKN